MKRFSFLLIGLLFFTCSTNDDQAYKSKTESAAFVHRSIKQVTDVIVHDIFPPPVASRIYAYTTVAGYEVARHGNPELVSLVGQLNGLENLPAPQPNVEYCFSLGAVQAILTVGKNLIFSEDQIENFQETIMAEFRATGLPDDVFERSVMYGNDMAAAIMEWASKDNYKQTRSFPKYTVTDTKETWKPTPPAYMDAIEPHWNKIRTFVIDSAQQFKPIPMVPFSLDENSDFYKAAVEVMEVGNNLTDEERAIAFFWDCNPFVMNVKGHVMFATKKISPGGHWINISRLACEKEQKDYSASMEVYARVALGLADAFISCWDEKFRSNVIRPETYINNHINAEWTPVLQTPPFPEYTSGHSVISSSAAVILTDLFGENYAFRDSTELEFGLEPRSFNSFIQASEEAARSRLYGGIHYNQACVVGITEGRAIGNMIVSKLKTRKNP